MNKPYLVLIFLSLLLINIKSNCQFENSDEITQPYELELNESKKYLPLDITFDFNMLNLARKNNPDLISESYLNKTKEYLKKASLYLKELFFMKKSFKIKFDMKIEEICNNSKITFYSNQYRKGLKTDFLIYPYYDFEEKNQFSTAGICAIEKISKRPIIAYIKIQTQIKELLLKVNENFYIPNIIHQLIHIMGFNKNSIRHFAYNPGKRISNLIHNKNFYLSMNNVNESLFNFNWKICYLCWFM